MNLHSSLISKSLKKKLSDLKIQEKTKKRLISIFRHTVLGLVVDRDRDMLHGDADLDERAHVA